MQLPRCLGYLITPSLAAGIADIEEAILRDGSTLVTVSVVANYMGVHEIASSVPCQREADVGASAPSSKAGKRAVDEGGRWIRVTKQRAKGNIRASTSEPAAKAVKVFTAALELERERKAEEGRMHPRARVTVFL
jgi:hypothetical protein